MKSIINAVSTSVQAFINDEEGAAMIEYGLLAALIAVVAVVTIPAIGTKLALVFTAIAAAIP
jgi:pilus assembly protein Flp/PilA